MTKRKKTIAREEDIIYRDFTVGFGMVMGGVLFKWLPASWFELAIIATVVVVATTIRFARLESRKERES